MDDLTLALMEAGRYVDSTNLKADLEKASAQAVTGVMGFAIKIAEMRPTDLLREDENGIAPVDQLYGNKKRGLPSLLSTYKGFLDQGKIDKRGYKAIESLLNALKSYLSKPLSLLSYLLPQKMKAIYENKQKLAQEEAETKSQLEVLKRTEKYIS